MTHPPAVSLLLTGAGVAAAVAMAALGVFAHRSGALPFAVVATVTWISGLLALANLVPGAGLDGGRIVRALAWARSADPAHFPRATQAGPHQSPTAGRPAGRPGAEGSTASAGPQPG
jgi:Zn-dependent protease